MEDRAGESVGGCTLEALIGVGRRGSTVWEASRGDEPRVAVKVVPAGDDETRDALQASARSAAAVRHPHLVSIHGHGSTVDGHVYVIMELLEGISLAERLSRGEPLPSTEAVHLVEQILDALSAAHREGLPHLELEPGDVFVRDMQDGPRATLLDVGLARPQAPPAPLAPDTDEPPATGLFYRAPELFVTGTGEAASDLYAVGAILVHVLTGRPPYAGSAADLGRAHLSRRPPRLVERGVEPDLADSAQVVVDRLMAKQPADRYASAAEARLAVSGLLGPAPPAAVDDDGFLDEMEDSFQNLAQVSASAERTPLPPPPVRTPPPAAPGPPRRPAGGPGRASIDSMEPAAPAGGGGKWPLVAVIALLAGVVIYLATRSDVVVPPPPQPDPAPVTTAVADARPPPPPPPVDARVPDAAPPKKAPDAAVAAAEPAPSTLTSTPEGALIVLADGTELGTTPYRGTLPAGATELEFRMEGHDSQIITLDAQALAAGGVQRSVELEEARKADPAAVQRWKARKRATDEAKAKAQAAARRTAEELAAEKEKTGEVEPAARTEPVAAQVEPVAAQVEPPPEKVEPPAETGGAEKARSGLQLLDRTSKTTGRTGRKGTRVLKLGEDTPTPAGDAKDGEKKVDLLQ